MLIIFALVAAGAWAGAQEEEKPASKMAMTSSGPQYGGTLTAFVRHFSDDPPGPAMKDAHRGSFHWLDHILEKPVIGDYEGVGDIAGGSGEYSFQLMGAIPDAYQIGNLLDSWDINFDRMIWYVKPGIMWSPTEVQSEWMPVRELTADDIVADIKEFVTSAYKRRFDGLLVAEGVNVIDKYTLQIDYHERYSADLFYFLGYEDRSVIGAPEMVAVPGRAERWENQVTTGPYRFDEYVVGSHMSFAANPTYRGKYTVDGEEFQLPFIEKVVLPIMPDPATRLAAMKTGKADMHVDMDAEYWDTLDKTAPDMLKASIAGGRGVRLAFRCDIPPFDNVNVRRAMMIGTDVTQHQYVWLASGMNIHYHPITPGHPSYTSLDKLPADIKELYDYNPDKAKKMLADAGYPNGFEMDFHTDATDPKAMDLASLVESQWAKIGVKVNIVTADQVEHTRKKYSHPPIWTGAFWDDIMEASSTRMFTMYHKTGVDLNYMAYSNPALDEQCELMERELDINKQNAQIKAAGDIVMRDAPAIPVSIIPTRIYWWPWVQNYYGAYTIQDDANYAQMVQYMWIDEGIKAELGF